MGERFCHSCSQMQVYDNCCRICGERFCDECFDHETEMCTGCLDVGFEKTDEPAQEDKPQGGEG